MADDNIPEPLGRDVPLKAALELLKSFQSRGEGGWEHPDELPEELDEFLPKVIAEVEGALKSESRYVKVQGAQRLLGDEISSLRKREAALSSLLHQLQSRADLQDMDSELEEAGIKLDDLWGRTEKVEVAVKNKPDPGSSYPLGHPVYFISGHLDLTDEEFDTQYVPQLEKAAATGAHFVVGDARGADFKAQCWLHRNVRHRRVTVFHMHVAPRHCVGFRTWGHFPTDEARDEAMTERSTADIAWVRPGRESSGTAKNLARRGKSS